MPPFPAVRDRLVLNALLGLGLIGTSLVAVVLSTTGPHPAE